MALELVGVVSLLKLEVKITFGFFGNGIFFILLENLSKIYPKVVTLTRKKVNYSNPNIQNVVVNFDNLNIESELNGVDHLYIALGTTRKKAGSAENFTKVDTICLCVFLSQCI